QDRLVHQLPGERVEIRHVDRCGPADRAQRPSDGDRLRAVDERAGQRRVFGALAAAGVDDDAALEVEDRNDSHRGTSSTRIPSSLVASWGASHTLNEQATRSLIDAENKTWKPGTRGLGAGPRLYGHDMGLRDRRRAGGTGHDPARARTRRDVP